MTSDRSVTPELQGQEKGQQGESASSQGASEERLGRMRGLLAVGGLLAGLLAFGAGEAVYDLIPAASVTQHALGLTKVSPTVATETVAEARNGALAFGVLGLFLGGCLGLAGGWLDDPGSRWRPEDLARSWGSPPESVPPWPSCRSASPLGSVTRTTN